MTWWLSNPTRFQEELDAIAALNLASFRGRGWRLSEKANLTLSFEICVRGDWVPLTLSYPSMFPATAPSVIPDGDRFLSGHQYGLGGELCLEIRPDNWEPQFTGAMMIESAARLLQSESEPEGRPVPSAHQQSLGQELRSRISRFVLTADTDAILKALPLNSVTPAVLTEHFIPDRFPKFQFLSQLRSIGEGEAKWVAARTVVGAEHPTVVIRVGDVSLPVISDEQELGEACSAIGQSSLKERLIGDKGHILLIVTDKSIGVWWIAKGDDAKANVINYRVVDCTQDSTARLPDEYGVLATKTVGIVGCGSLGSKIAESLVRSGVTSLMLVDDDIILPGNLVRQNYSGEFIGAHKADALKRELLRINPDADIRTRRVHLGGQESAETTSSVLEDLGGCDLIVDATADPVAFNLIASAIVTYQKPMVWGEVLAGGIGGFVARSRPGYDPAPMLVRRAFAEWCETQDVRWPPQGTRAYEAILNGKPMLADDGDVAVIAAHMSRFALDILVSPSESKFPGSLYAVGLAPEWAFTAPFQTICIEMMGAEGWVSAGEKPTAETFKKSLSILTTILPKSDADEPPAAA